MKYVRDYTAILLGTALAGLALNVFLVPNDIAPGGFSGIGVIMNYLIGVKVGTVVLVLNIPLMIIAFIRLGKAFLIKSGAGIALYAVFADHLAFGPWTSNVILASVFGGAMLGAGLGLVLRYGGTTGGTDVLARLIRHKSKMMSMGTLIMIIDSVIIAVWGLVQGAEQALISILTMFLCSWVMDIIIQGFNTAKAFFIISKQSDLIAERIIKEVGRGVTGLYSKGMFSGIKDKVLLCIIEGNSQIAILKSIIRDVDNTAFLVATDVREVMGYGFERDNI